MRQSDVATDRSDLASIQSDRNRNNKNGLFSIFLHKIICCECVLESPKAILIHIQNI